jgi:predicted DNA-binding antitoxin AbrB/MazE fold protein
MYKTIEAVYKDGVFKPLRKLKLPEYDRFKLTIAPIEEDEKKIKKTVEKQKKALLRLAGIGSSGVSDISKKHNEYLYGKSCREK